MNQSTDNHGWKQPRLAQEPGRLGAGQANALPDTAFALPRLRKEPMTDASHVRSALARFNQVIDVSDTERDHAFANIQKAARYYDVEMRETDWRQLGRRGRSKARASNR